MSDIAVRGEHLSKSYRIGKAQERSNGRWSFLQTAAAPFRYLASTLRPPAPDETIWALKDVSFEVKRGEVVGIIGRNGAGKSTLLKILSRITEPTSGRAVINGRVGSLLEVGTGFHPELTGRENIYLNGAILGMRRTEIERKFDEIVDFSDIEKFLDTPVKRYSSGMYVRLAFAVAAHLEPEILLVDEVLAVGDTAFQKKCLGKMEDITKKGRTVLFVSHNMLAIENLCPRSIWVDAGKIREDGDSRKLVHAYLSGFGTGKVGLDLCSDERHRGTGEIRYTRVEWLNAQKQPVGVIRSGDDLVIRLHYHVNEQISNSHFIISISTEIGTIITQIATFLMGYQIPALEPGPGYIDLEISFLNLMPGRYYISLAIWNQKSGAYHDDLRNCIALDVEASDFYQSGQGIEGRYGIIFLPCKWYFDHSNVEEA